MSHPNPDDDDLDDLDDEIAQFSPSAGPRVAPTAQQDFPDPDDDELLPLSSSGIATAAAAGTSSGAGTDGGDVGDGDELDMDKLAQEFEANLQRILAGNHSSAAAASGATTSADGAEADEEDDGLDTDTGDLLARLAAFSGGQAQTPGQGENDDDDALAKLLAQMLGATGAPTGSNPSSSAGRAPPATASDAGAGGADFQATMRAAMARMRESSSAADDAHARATTASSSATGARGAAGGLAGLAGAAGGGLDGMDEQQLAALLQQLGGEAGGGEEGLQGMLDDVMGQLMSREMLYEPLKELADKYPSYLQENGASLSAEDKARYTSQYAVVQQIVARFDAESEHDSEDTKRERGAEVIELVGKMNDFGAPPSEIVGDLPNDMELGDDGLPKLPQDCLIS